MALRHLSLVAWLVLVGCGGDDEKPSKGAAGASGTAGAGGQSGSGGASGAGGSAATGAAGAGGADAGPGANPYPAPGDWPANAGPGGPTATYAASALYQNCAFLNGGPLDTTDHHNLVVMYDGYLLMPWAPESGAGGLSFFDFTDPCSPTLVHTGFSPQMRETHSIAFSEHGARRYAVVNSIKQRDTQGAGGVQFWDVTDTSNVSAVSLVDLPDFFYPDAYARVVLSVFWVGRYVYAAAGDSGLAIVDAADPLNPSLVKVIPFNPVLRAGQVQVIGNLLVLTPASFGRTVLMDVSDPPNPQPIPGGEYFPAEGFHYFSNFAAGRIYYTRNDLTGGLFVYDVSDPTAPRSVGNTVTGGAGGYVFVKDHLAFTGQSDDARLIDITDHANMVEVATLDLQGDMDTMTPIGNVAVLSVDDGAPVGGGTAVAPYDTEPDTRAPRVTWAWPKDGATNVAVASSVGVTFSEMVDVKSAWVGSVRLYETGTAPGDTRVDGDINVQELIVNFTPRMPLRPGTSYTLEIPKGGVVDYNGNAVSETFTTTFVTGP